MSPLAGTLLDTLGLATPLLIAALGETVVQKSGVVNVGLEGMLLAGAFAASIGTLHTHNPYLGVLIAAVAGLLFALVFAAFALGLSANQVVVGIVINLLALGVTGTLYRQVVASLNSSLLQTAALPPVAANLNILTPLAFGAVPLVWWGLNRTRRGLELRACGEQPTAAEAAGVRVLRLRLLAVLFGGAMAGIAGAFLSVGRLNTFIEGMSGGRGFIALAIVTSGRWSPWGCALAALVFGAADALQFQGQAMQHFHLPNQLFLALPYLITLVILTTGGKSVRAPAALGTPYKRG